MAFPPVLQRAVYCFRAVHDIPCICLDANQVLWLAVYHLVAMYRDQQQHAAGYRRIGRPAASDLALDVDLVSAELVDDTPLHLLLFVPMYR